MNIDEERSAINGIKNPSSTPLTTINRDFVPNLKQIPNWKIKTVLQWLKSIGYEETGPYFVEQKINGRALLMLSEDDLKEVIKHNVGQRKNLFHLIRLLQVRYNRFINNLTSSSDDDASSNDDNQEDENENDNETSKRVNSNHNFDGDNESDSDLNVKQSDSEYDDFAKKDVDNTRSNRSDDYSENYSNKSSKRKGKTPSPSQSKKHLKENGHIKLGSGLGLRSRTKKNSNRSETDLDEDNDEHVMANYCENCLKRFNHSPYMNFYPNGNHNSLNSHMPIRNIRGEKRKTLMSVFYLFLTCLWTSFMLTVVHDRVPDMEKYPPLPDIILDNVPLIPWAFFATELIGLALVITCLIILFFHKYRSIIFRRICSLGGTIFFLRSITMLITSLSVPGVHIQCSSQRYGNLLNKLEGALKILSGAGLYVHGVRTCGDYMFSGHTVWLTLLTHFIVEYTPRSMSWLHTSVWIANVFGLFFILGAHEHYSIDVFVAFYITSRLFLYYHSLANSKVLFQRGHKRVRIWFPLFSYFESNIHSIVPNEYELPPNIFYYTYKLIKNKIIKKIYALCFSNSSKLREKVALN